MDEQTTPGVEEPDPTDDLAAEPDDTDAADGDGSEPTDDGDAPQYTGICWGGPYSGRTVVSRYPLGFWLVDRPSGYFWTYETTPPGAFTWHGIMTKIDEAALAEVTAGSDYDVLAYDPQPGGVTP